MPAAEGQQQQEDGPAGPRGAPGTTSSSSSSSSTAVRNLGEAILGTCVLTASTSFQFGRHLGLAVSAHLRYEHFYPGTSLWEAAYDQDQAVLGATTAEDEEEEEEDQGPASSNVAAGAADDGIHSYVTVDKASKLGIRVRDDDPRLSHTCCVTQFDPLPGGAPGVIEASGVVAIGDFLVKVRACDPCGAIDQ
jgi:hypothetical protein